MASVLIIEDDDNIRKFGVLNLRARGYQVKEAADAETGLDYLRDGESFDVVLLDIKMPGMSGLDLLDLMAEDGNQLDIPVVVMTASSGAVNVELQDYKQVKAVLVKPVDVTRLVETVRQAIEGA